MQILSGASFQPNKYFSFNSYTKLMQIRFGAYVCMRQYVFMHVSMYVCMYVCVYQVGASAAFGSGPHVCICQYVCMYVCMYVCIW